MKKNKAGQISMNEKKEHLPVYGIGQFLRSRIIQQNVPLAMVRYSASQSLKFKFIIPNICGG